MNKHENLQTRIVLAAQGEYISVPTLQNLTSLYRGLNCFSHIYSPDDLNNALLSQGCVLETALAMGMMGRTYIPRTGECVRSL